MGQPPYIFTEKTDTGVRVVAWYFAKEAWLDEGKVIDVREARPMQLPPAGQDPRR